MSLLSLDEARAELKIDARDSSVDEQLQRYVDAIARVVENHVGEVIDVRTVTERLRLRGQTHFTLRKVPVVSLTSLTGLSGVVYPTTGMDVDPATGVVEMFRGNVPGETVVAVYQAGYADDAVPLNYKRGALVILQHVWETQRGVGTQFGGVIGEEERLNRLWMYGPPRKALEWLGDPMPSV